jgi:ribosomal protein L39E
MARYKLIAKKLKLGKQGRRTRWAPFWIIPKALGKGKRVHPARFTRLKRSWRKTEIDKAIKRQKRRYIKSGRIKKKY